LIVKIARYGEKLKDILTDLFYQKGHFAALSDMFCLVGGYGQWKRSGPRGGQTWGDLLLIPYNNKDRLLRMRIKERGDGRIKKKKRRQIVLLPFTLDPRGSDQFDFDHTIIPSPLTVQFSGASG
jgi:hypothetical protein